MLFYLIFSKLKTIECDCNSSLGQRDAGKPVSPERTVQNQVGSGHRGDFP